MARRRDWEELGDALDGAENGRLDQIEHHRSYSTTLGWLGRTASAVLAAPDQAAAVTHSQRDTRHALIVPDVAVERGDLLAAFIFRIEHAG